MQAQQRLPLRSQEASQPNHLPAQRGKFVAEFVASGRQHRFLEFGHAVLRLFDDIAHPRGEFVGQFDQEFARIHGTLLAVQRLDNVFNGKQNSLPGADDAVLINPQSNGHHIFGIGAGIEVDSAQRD